MVNNQSTPESGDFACLLEALALNVGLSVGAGYQLLVGENVDRILSKNQHNLNIFPTYHQHPLHLHISSTRNPTTYL